jgi:hypothetical protein
MDEHQHGMAVTAKNRSTRRTRCTWQPSRFRVPVKKKNRGPPARAERLKIFTLNRKDWLSVAKWPWLGHNDNIEKYSNICNIVRLLPDLRVPVICTGFHPSRRHCWCSVTFGYLLSVLILQNVPCSFCHSGDGQGPLAAAIPKTVSHTNYELNNTDEIVKSKWNIYILCLRTAVCWWATCQNITSSVERCTT